MRIHPFEDPEILIAVTDMFGVCGLTPNSTRAREVGSQKQRRAREGLSEAAGGVPDPDVITSCSQAGALEKLAREIPSFCIRKYKVERFIPNRVAAPFEPATTQFVCFKVLQM